jgi:hypothetical protein
MEASAGSMTQFTGTLVGRQYKPGQKYIQLVFKTAEGLHLSITRNLQMVRSLSVGNTYQVKGEIFTLGKKKVIREPVAILVQPQAKKAFYKRRSLIIVSAAVLLIGGSASAITLKPHSVTPATAKVVVKKVNISQTQSTPAQTSTPASTPPAAPEATTTPVKKATVVKTTPKTTTPAVAATQTSSSTPAASDNQSSQSTDNSNTPSDTAPGDTTGDTTPPPPPPPPVSGDPSGGDTP